MVKKLFILLLLVLLLLNISFAQKTQKKYGIGIQITPLSSGISFLSDINRDFSLQGIIGTSNYGHSSLSLRGLYKLDRGNFWDIYGILSLSLWGFNDGLFPGFSGGVGIEYDWRGLDKKLPPVFWNIELTLYNIPRSNYINFGAGLGFYLKF